MCRRQSPWTVRSLATRTCSSSPNSTTCHTASSRRASARHWSSWGLTADGERLVGQYSGGMVRRLEIAQSTLHRPRVLFLDEPTVGLDPIARDAVWKHLVDLRTNYGTTLFFTTHYLEEAQSY